MKNKYIFLLIVLAAIWGSSFMFMRVLSPVLGPIITASIRLIIGGLFLLFSYKVIGIKIIWREQWKLLLFIGVISQAIPYFLFAYAALYIDSNISVILNSTAPMFGLILSIAFLSEKFKPIQLVGIVFGTSGVIIISAVNNINSNKDFLVGVLLCLFAAFMYGLSSVFVKSKATVIDSKTVASIGQIFAGISLLPFLILFPPTGEVTIDIIVILIIFGTLCSGIAGFIYFKLILEAGPVKALTVTYLMPLFGFAWSYLFLSEKLTLGLLSGGLTIILGTVFITYEKK